MTMLDRIYNAEEERQRADKALRLNGVISDNSQVQLRNPKPTLKIKRLAYASRPNVKGASSLQKELMDLERIKAEKALRLNS